MTHRRPKRPSTHTPLRIAFASPIPVTIRGQILCLVSSIIGAKGAGYLLGITPPSTDAALSLLTQYMPVWVVGLIILAVCGFAWFTSYCHHGRDQYGYDALTALTAGLAGVYLVSALHGSSYDFERVILWLLLSAAALAGSRLYHGRRAGLARAAAVVIVVASGLGLAATLDVPGVGIQGFLTYIAIAVLTVFMRRLRDVRDEPPYRENT